MVTPSPNGANSRDAKGRFAAENGGGPGNPYARRVANLRAALLDAVSDEDLKTIVSQLVDMAKRGSLPAIKEILDRTIGKPQTDVSVDLLVDRAEADDVVTIPDIRQLRLALLTEPEYLEYHRSRALADGFLFSWIADGRLAN